MEKDKEEKKRNLNTVVHSIEKKKKRTNIFLKNRQIEKKRKSGTFVNFNGGHVVQLTHSNMN